MILKRAVLVLLLALSGQASAGTWVDRMTLRVCEALENPLVNARTPGGRHLLAEQSGHLVPFDQPEIIVSCVRETAAAVKAGAW